MQSKFTICENCDKRVYQTRKNTTRFCSAPCRIAAYKRRSSMPQGAKQSSGTQGAIGELFIASFLMDLGFPILRALSPNCHIDLAVFHRGMLLGIEVRTGWRNTLTKTISFMRKNRGADLFAVRLRGEDPLFESITADSEDLIREIGERKSIWESQIKPF